MSEFGRKLRAAVVDLHVRRMPVAMPLDTFAAESRLPEEKVCRWLEEGTLRTVSVGRVEYVIPGQHREILMQTDALPSAPETRTVTASLSEEAYEHLWTLAAAAGLDHGAVAALLLEQTTARHPGS